jgi:SIR2-like domain
MLGNLEKSDWEVLLRRIKQGNCTPFLGAGACFGTLPSGGEIAREWAKSDEYPLPDSAGDLMRVSQYLAVYHNDAMYPKERILDVINTDQTPDFSMPDEPHATLADLPLPIYMTTNYDNFMVRALEHRGKQPKRELCRWNEPLRRSFASIFESADGFTATPESPVVFHLHGHNENSDSLVLTEDDYLDFMVHISQDTELLPLRIQQALAESSLLFIGYGLADWDFRVLFQELVVSRPRAQRRLSIMVQRLPENIDPEAAEKLKNFLDKYYDDLGIRVYWGSATAFAADLRQHWEEFTNRVTKP